ncbi:MAG: hypothetical protein H0U79_06615 [Solirubrobacterales bacterium]|nr:hypothetical protein [Solirubrobacterales bacterium]
MPRKILAVVGAALALTLTAATSAPAADLRVNHLQSIGSHNSYHDEITG